MPELSLYLLLDMHSFDRQTFARACIQVGKREENLTSTLDQALPGHGRFQPTTAKRQPPWLLPISHSLGWLAMAIPTCPSCS
jgi:hypothetical protein